jgi:hypothetical protein
MTPVVKVFDVAYLVLSGTTTAARCPELLRRLVGLGFSTVIAIPTPNASRVVAQRDLADVGGYRSSNPTSIWPSARTATWGRAVRAVQLQLNEQTRTRHRRRSRVIRGR